MAIFQNFQKLPKSNQSKGHSEPDLSSVNVLYLSLVEHTNSQNTVAQVNTFLSFIVTFYQIIKNSIQKTVVNSVKTQIHRLGRTV